MMKIQFGWSRSGVLWLVLMYVSFVPLTFGAGNAHDLSRWLQIQCLLVVAVWIAWNLWQRSDESLCSEVPTLLAWGLLAASAAASAVRSAYPQAAFQELELLLGLLATAWGVSRCDFQTGMRALCRTASFGSFGYFFVVLAVFVAAMASGQTLNARLLHLGFDNPRFFNHAQCLMLPLVCVWSLQASGKLERRLAFAMLSLHFAWLLLDLARATALALLSGSLLVWWLGSRLFAVRMLVGLMAGGVVWAILFQILPTALASGWAPSFASSQELTSDHSRMYLWNLAFDMALTHPILGAGPMHFAATLNAKAAHPHNLILQLASEYGFLWAGLLVTMLLRPLVRAAKRLQFETAFRNGTLAALLCAASAGLVDSCFSGNFVMPMPQMWLVLVFGMLWSATSLPGTKATRFKLTGLRSKRMAIAFGVALLASQLFLSIQASQQLHFEPPRLRENSPESLPGEPLRPRFWANGWI